MSSKKEPKTKVDELKEALARKKAHHVQKEAAAESSPEGLDELTKQVAAAEEEAKAHYDKLLRMMAELDNFKKRTEREKQEMVKYGNEKLIKDLLPVLDDLDRVLQHLPQGASKDLTDFVDGVQLVAKHFSGILEKYGLTQIKTDGKFNPEFHEAVAHLPSDDAEPDHIIEVHRKGYMLHDRVIRAAMVSVSKGS